MFHDKCTGNFDSAVVCRSKRQKSSENKFITSYFSPILFLNPEWFVLNTYNAMANNPTVI